MEAIYSFFNFVGSLISTISDGITGTISILSSIINLIVSITKILPSPLYPCLLTFLSVYATIFVYKIIRKG